MAWHEVTHRQTGETQHVSCLDGYPDTEWVATRLTRKPRPHERHVGGGRLRRDTAAAEEAERIRRYRKLGPAGLIALLDEMTGRLADAEARLARLEGIAGGAMVLSSEEGEAR